MAIIKGARNLDNAKKFVDWALTVDAQKIGLEVKEYAIPTNSSVPLPPHGAEPHRRQGHRLRLREVRLERDAQAAARALGEGNQRGARSDARAGAAPRARLWLAVGAVGFALVPVVRAAGLDLVDRLAPRTGSTKDNAPALAAGSVATGARGCGRSAALLVAGVVAVSRRALARVARERADRHRRARLRLHARRRASRSARTGWYVRCAQRVAVGRLPAASTGWASARASSLRVVRDAVRAGARRPRLLQGRRVRRRQRRRGRRAGRRVHVLSGRSGSSSRRCRTPTARFSLAAFARAPVHREDLGRRLHRRRHALRRRLEHAAARVLLRDRAARRSGSRSR